MAQYYGAPPNQGYAPTGGPNNLEFYASNYAQPVSGHATPSQASYGYGGPGVASGFNSGFGGGAGVTGRLGENGNSLRTGWLAALSTEGYDGEPPLLQELGIKFPHIRSKTLAVLNPFRRIDQHLMDDSDLGGPLIFVLLFGTCLRLSGSIHFGYVYGLGLFGSISLHTILSLMAPSDTAPNADYPAVPTYPGQPTADGSHGMGGGGSLSGTLTFLRSTSVLGYCLLPLVLTSLVGIVMPMHTTLGIALTTAAIIWCTYSASGIFCAITRMRAMRLLVAYPLALFYVGFGIMGVFSSRGSGSPKLTSM